MSDAGQFHGGAVLVLHLLAALVGRPGEIQGVAINADRGRPIVGATVSIEALGRRAYADSNGTFGFSAVTPGRYQVRVERIRYAARRIDGVAVTATAGSRVSLALREHVLIDGCEGLFLQAPR